MPYLAKAHGGGWPGEYFQVDNTGNTIGSEVKAMEVETLQQGRIFSH